MILALLNGLLVSWLVYGLNHGPQWAAVGFGLTTVYVIHNGKKG